MNTKRIFLLLSICWMTIHFAKAEGDLGAHSFIIWANGGIARYIGSTPQASPTIGGGGGLGLGYEWRDRTFLLQTGLGARYVKSGFKGEFQTYGIPECRDSEGDVLTYKYLESNRKDTYTQITAQIPLLVGAHASHFYFLAGAKINLHINQKAEVKGNYSTIGDYNILIDPLANMENHQFYTNRTLTMEKKHSMKVNVAASAEVGGEFNLREGRNGDIFFRVAAFADFSILDDRIKSSSPTLALPSIRTNVDKQDMMQGVTQVDYLSSSTAENPLRQLYAGIKLTVVFSTNLKYGCVMCEGGYPSRRDLRRGSRLMH